VTSLGACIRQLVAWPNLRPHSTPTGDLRRVHRTGGRSVRVRNVHTQPVRCGAARRKPVRAGTAARRQCVCAGAVRQRAGPRRSAGRLRPRHVRGCHAATAAAAAQRALRRKWV
jgi:hypothetical protein